MPEEEKANSDLVRIDVEALLAPSELVSRMLADFREGSVASAVTDLAGVPRVYIPAGWFTMGSEEWDAAKPVRQVYLDAFWIAKNLVTVAEFRKFCVATGGTYDWDGRKPAWGWIDDHPMVRVTWDEARAYCKWAGGDLPTEAQWERAARGTDGRNYPWGNDWEGGRHCRHSDKAWGDAKSTAPVGSYPTGASPDGVLDMAGNVWQWCLDWYGPNYASLPDRNPKGPASGTRRVLRGGSWSNCGPQLFRSAFRDNRGPASQGSYFGFRLAGPP